MQEVNGDSDLFCTDSLVAIQHISRLKVLYYTTLSLIRYNKNNPDLYMWKKSVMSPLAFVGQNRVLTTLKRVSVLLRDGCYNQVYIMREVR